MMHQLKAEVYRTNGPGRDAGEKKVPESFITICI